MCKAIKKIYGIKTDIGYYITCKPKKMISSEYSSYYESDFLGGSKVNGEELKNSFLEDWYKLESSPIKLETKKSNVDINHRYEIKDKSMITLKLPEVISYEDMEVDSDGDCIDSRRGLYEHKYDIKIGEWEAEAFEFELVFKCSGFFEPEKFEYVGAEHRYPMKGNFQISSKDICKSFLDKMIFPKLLLHTKPSKLSSKDFYDITREHIKRNINLDVAKITSDYDFCFTVKKIIPLFEPKKVNYSYPFAKTKKQRNKIYSKIKNHSEKEIFEMTHQKKGYQDYTIIPDLVAPTEKDLKFEIDSFLSALMKSINEPIIPCKHCKGEGYIKEIQKFKIKK